MGIIGALLLASWDATILQWMTHAFYPVLLGILIVASLGLPIPEDVPLIAAGVILRTQEGYAVATWPGTIVVALIGIMSGDLVLYTAGKMWGRDVVRHRFVRSLITPDRFDWMVGKFHRYGGWMCFFGRFFMGVRAVMCITAGATRFPYWRFFLADFAGALLSVPFFIWLGYLFAGMIPLLKRYMAGFQWAAAGLVVLALIAYAVWEYRKFRRNRQINAQYTAVRGAPPATGDPPGGSDKPGAAGPPTGGARPWAAPTRSVVADDR